MAWGRIKIRPADKLMSEYVRKRDKFKCQYGFKCFHGEGSQTSHFQKRRKETVRFDPRNCDWVCGKCHYFVENDPNGQRTLEKFKREQLGEKEYNSLMMWANTPGRKDDALAIIYIKKLLETV